MSLLTASLLALLAQDAPAPAPRPTQSLRSAQERLAALDVAGARAALDAVPAGQRGFEWRHLALRAEVAADPASGVVPVTRLRAGGAVGPVRFTPDGARLVAPGADGALRVWDARSAELLRTIEAQTDATQPVACSPAGGLALCAGPAPGARVLDLETGATRFELRGHDAAVGPVAWSLDGERLATGSADRTLRLWDARSGSSALTVRGHAAALTAVAFSPAGGRVLSAALDGSARVWDLRNGAQLLILRGGEGAVLCAAYDRRGERIATGHADHVVRLWSAESGDLLRELSGHTGPVTGVGWSADGSRLASASEDASARVWDPASGEELLALAGQGGPLSGVDFAPDGARLATSCQDGLVRVFESDAARARSAQGGGRVELPDDATAHALKPLELDGRLRRALARADLPPAMYRRAEELARANLERLPESGQVESTLGAALFRAGKAQEGLDTLLSAAGKHRGWPPNLAFRALCLAALGRADEARDWANRLEVLLREPRWKDNQEMQSLRIEVRRAAPDGGVSGPAPARK